MSRLSRGLRVCFRCKRRRQKRSFLKNRARRDGLSVYCASCHNKYNKERIPKEQAIIRSARWASKNPERRKASGLAHHLKKKGGISRTVDEIVLDMQSKRICPYCGTVLYWRNFSYDFKEGVGSDVHPVCIACNLLKAQFHHEDFRAICKLLGLARILFYHKKLSKRRWPPLLHKEKLA